jgi:hypothetical protein
MVLSAEQIDSIVREIEAAGLHSRIIVIPLASSEVDIIVERRMRVPTVCIGTAEVLDVHDTDR